MFKSKSAYIFVVAIAFILFQLYILVNSFPAIHRMYSNIPAVIETRGQFWTLFWFLSELSGEIGLILRFIGACLFVVFAWVLSRRKEFSLSFFRKAVLIEGVYYLFYIPFITYLFTRPVSQATRALLVYRETAISYTIQTILIFLSFILLYKKTRLPNITPSQLSKWGAIAVVSFIFALWVKHFMFNLYALPIDFSNPVLLVGLLNSTLTMLAAAIIMLVTLMPVIRGRSTSFSSRAVGIAFITLGIYFIVYIFVALNDSTYMAFLPLTELWAIAFTVLGAGFLKERTQLKLD